MQARVVPRKKVELCSWPHPFINIQGGKEKLDKNKGKVEKEKRMKKQCEPQTCVQRLRTGEHYHYTTATKLELKL